MRLNATLVVTEDIKKYTAALSHTITEAEHRLGVLELVTVESWENDELKAFCVNRYGNTLHFTVSGKYPFTTDIYDAED